MAKKLTAAVVGCGAGGKLSINALTASDRFQLVAVCDMRREAAAAAAKAHAGVAAYGDWRAMFRERPVDVVCVSTYAPSHPEIALAALELPLKGILVEKPLSDRVRSARALLDAVKRRGIPLAVPHGLMAAGHSLEILALLRGGEIGDCRLVEIEFVKWDIINAGIHWLNFFVALTGNDPLDWVMASCESSTRTWRDGMQVETTGVVYARTKGGVRLVMQSGDDTAPDTAGKGMVYRIVGTKGTIEFYGWENVYRIVNAKHPGGETVVPAVLPVTGHRRHLEAMARTIDTGAFDYSVADASLSALEICEGAYLASRHGCKVLAPVDAFTPPPKPSWDPGAPYGGSGGGRDGRKL